MALTITPEVVKTLAMESLYENVKNFNAQSGGGISLISHRHKGDFLEEHFLKFQNFVSYRDPYSTNKATFKTISSELQRSPKIAYKAKVVIMPSEIKRYGGNEKVVIAKISKAIGEQITKQFLSSALICANAAISSNAASVIDNGCSELNHKMLLRAIQPFGDNAMNIRTFVMHSGSLFSLLSAGFDVNSDTVVNGVIYNASPASLGRKIYSVDMPEFMDTADCDGDSANGEETQTLKILALQRGGVQVIESESSEYLVETDGRGENIVYRISAEGSFDVKIAGFSYKGLDTVKNATEISKSTNWKKVATDIKATAGTILVHKA